MSRIPRRFCALAAFLVTLNVAGLFWIRHEMAQRNGAEMQDQPIRLVSTFPTENVDQAERLSLHFDRNVGDVKQLNKQLDTATPFKLSPIANGDWMWVTPRQLDFVLNKPLPAGNSFKVTPAVGIHEQLGQIIQVDNEVEFQTRALKLESCRLVSSDLTDVTFELLFNQKVAVDAALQSIIVWTADSKIASSEQLKVESLVQEPSKSLVLRCSRPATNTLFITIDGKLTGHEATRSLGKSVEKTLTVQPVFAFVRSEVHDLGLDEFFHVNVYFTTGLAPTQKLPPIAVTPKPAQFNIELSEDWQTDGRFLQLQGSFEPGRRYQATLPKTMLSMYEKTLGDDVVITFDIPDRRPQVAFTDYHGILSPGGNLNLDVRTVNVDRLRIGAARVHANNLIAHLQGEWKQRTSRKLGEETIKFEAKKNATVMQTMSLREVLASGADGSADRGGGGAKELPHGIYHVSIDATDESWVSDSTVVTITDLAITVKQTGDAMMVWVTSLKTAQPVKDVAVSTVAFNNQTLATATTDEFGIARMAIDPKHPDGKPWVVLAQSGDQTSWNLCDQDHWVLDQVDQSGRTPRALDVLLFTDRGTYRPGETIQLSGVIRDDKGKTVPSFPIDLKVVRPDGKTVTTLKVEPQADAEGTFTTTWTSPENSWTGPWRFRATLIDDDETIGATHAYVEEFVPIRIDLNSAAASPLFVEKDSSRLNVHARYLFGPPAAGLQVRVDGDFRATRFRSSQLAGFTFGPKKIDDHHSLETITGQLAADGSAQIDIKDPPPLELQRYAVSTVATVTEDGGRSVSRLASFVRDAASFHIGLKNSTSGVVVAGKDTDVAWTLRTPDDKPADFVSLNFELVRVEYDNVLRRVNGHTVWESVERTESIWKHTIGDAKAAKLDAAGIGNVSISCPKTGTYRLSVSDQAGASTTELEFFVSDQGANATSLALNQPEQIELKLDRDSYKPGDAGSLFVNSPFVGRLWVTLESDQVHWSQVIDLKTKSSTVAFDVPKELRGGGFFTASVVRPINPAAQEWLPHRARGVVRLETDHSDAKIPVTITTPTRVEPNSEVEVSATAIPGALIQVWAVDEGILATSGFQTPNAHGHFFAQRANGVTSSDIFGRLLPDHRRPDSMNRIGGDAGEGVDSLRRNPIATRRREPAIILTTFQRADEQGRVAFKANVPNFTGELRWMAVAVRGDQYGKAQQATTVTSDFLAEATWPRFAAPGDHFEVPVRLINTTTQEVKATIAAIVTGPLDIMVSNPEVILAANANQIVWLNVTANEIGSVAGHVSVTSIIGNAAAKTSRSDFTLAVRAANPLITDRIFVSLKAGEDFGLDLGDRQKLGAQKALLTLSSDSIIDLQPAVDHLLHYPYGCVEQTTSQLRAVLAASELIGGQNAQGNRAEAARQLTSAGVSRLWAMQLKSGALSYWPGQSSPHEWGTVYATLALLDARSRGIEVDERFLESLQKYLATELHQSSGRDPNVSASICLALSRLDSPPVGWMSRLTERIGDLDMGGRANLAQAWFAAGRKDRANEVLREDTIDLPIAASYSQRFTSETAQRAELARALQKIDPSHVWLPRLITQIKQAKQNGAWLSTLENALVIETLAADRTLRNVKPFSGKVMIGDEPFEMTPGTSKTIDLSKRSGDVAIKTTGDGTVSLMLHTTSLSTDPAPDLDRLIRVRRNWLDRHGNQIDRETIRVGDLVVVEVTLEAIGRKQIESIAIVDPLPAGFEVENPRLQTSDQSANASVASHTEFLDDRVVLFSDAPANPRTFRYSIRAVTEGAFAVPPIQATCMYNESIESVSGASQIRIARIANNAPLSLATDQKPTTAIK